MVQKKHVLAKLALLTATIIWGSSFFMMKDALDDLGTFYLLAMRFTGACALLALVFFRKLRKLDLPCIKAGFFMGTALIAAYGVQTLGLMDTTPGKNAFLTAGYCIMVPFMYWVIAGKKPDRFNLVAAVICILGIGLVSLDSNLSMGRGDFLTIICGFFYGLHIIISARFTQKHDVMLLTICQFFFAAVWSWVIGGIFETAPDFGTMQTGTIVVIAYLSVFATAGALGLQTYGLKYTEPSAGALILSLEAVFGVLFSVMVGAEAMTLRLFIGFSVIFVAIVISETKLDFILKKRTGSECCSGEC